MSSWLGLKLCVLFQRKQREQRRGREQAEPAVASGRRKVAHVQLRGRVLSPAESRAKLWAPAAGEHVPPGRFRLPAVRPWCASAGARHARTRAPATGLLVGTPNLQSCGSRLLRTQGALSSGLTRVSEKSSPWFTIVANLTYRRTVVNPVIKQNSSRA